MAGGWREAVIALVHFTWTSLGLTRLSAWRQRGRGEGIIDLVYVTCLTLFDLFDLFGLVVTMKKKGNRRRPMKKRHRTMRKDTDSQK